VAQCGFTLTELVAVMIIAGILAAIAMTRVNTLSFDTSGYAARVAAMIRYGQKIAVSQRRDVHVVIAASSVSLCYSAGCGADALPEPPGTSAFVANAPGDVTVSGGPSFRFSSLGKPFIGASPAASAITVTISGDGTRDVVIEKETGFVH
jgi:MSHA pilin protein MshC